MTTTPREIREALDDIMGEELAAAIIKDMGIRWAIVAAMADPAGDNKPRSRAALRKFGTEPGMKS